ncbi:hypothetical protein HMPREF0083_01495 [Aneurinibacillus aneurinilyticus ATCC 12856]|uniref:Uncharacterized protein n=1 Tax=Aneurinibacillus aneurinilyticus ATCC 12856 TaxID=649747 RepID=U1YI09_ANEAE|nr:hypothetical protein HMPREF0083_01495 [Aneurinibacillus aneurinilyticus ATCC 12856]
MSPPFCLQFLFQPYTSDLLNDISCGGWELCNEPSAGDEETNTDGGSTLYIGTFFLVMNKGVDYPV